MIFKKVDGSKVLKITNHIKDMLSNHPDAEIHIGTDSQNHRRFSVYCTVIAFKMGSRGVHYIYHKQSLPKIKDIWSRLWKETEFSIEVAEYVKSRMNVDIQIDMDFNKDKMHISNKLVSASRGWANSLGYKVNIKPFSQIATKAADHYCR